MPIETPAALVEEFKKSGEFDRIRRELLQEFQKDDSYTAFQGKIEEIVKQRLAKAQMLHYLPQDMVQKELGQEVERYPIVERAVADVQLFSDPTFIGKLGDSLQKVLQTANEKSSAPATQQMTEPEKDILVPPAETTPSIENTTITAPSPTLIDAAPVIPRIPSPGPPPTPDQPPLESTQSLSIDATKDTPATVDGALDAPQTSADPNFEDAGPRPSSNNDMVVDKN
ncbi:hypothetical protein CPB83DRAFT_843301 [Crepidotus variabilis]|uniref:BOD1/SHG1 domain-containing protein n=1 Tax=Crepidotus variabilis TaxID=179855 RepID=A0A9P6JWG2_9AGAR|nr:hypothetical protein CPB83DRAFT_843301 [Crepidotus variabilis]